MAWLDRERPRLGVGLARSGGFWFSGRGEAAFLVRDAVPHIDMSDTGLVGAAAVKTGTECRPRALAPQWRQATDKREIQAGLGWWSRPPQGLRRVLHRRGEDARSAVYIVKNLMK
jgi:hypothetical protein